MAKFEENFFPRAEGNTTTMIQKICDYLHRITERLKYVLKNLGKDNFNKNELKDFLTMNKDGTFRVASEDGTVVIECIKDEEGTKLLIRADHIQIVGNEDTTVTGNAFTQINGGMLAGATAAEGFWVNGKKVLTEE